MRVGIIGHPQKIKNVYTALKNKKDLAELVALPLVKTSADDVEKVAEFQKSVDFIIFCGVYDYMYFLKNMEFEKTAGYIKNDLTALCITLLTLSMSGIRLESISIDGYSPMEVEHICDELGVKQAQLFKGAYNNVEIVDDTDMLMEEMSAFHQSLYFSKKVRACVTCMSPVYEKLKLQNINCILVRNTHESIRSEYENLKNKYLLNQKDRAKIVAIEIKLIHDVNDNLLLDEIDAIRENAKIIEKLILFAKRMNASMDLVSNNHYVLFCESNRLEKETNSYTNFAEFAEIKSNYNTRIHVGIGFGNTPFEIRKNARKAYLYSTEEKESCIYLSFDTWNIEGPIKLKPKEKRNEFQLDEYCNRTALLTGLSSNTVHRLVKIYKQTKGKQYTINELADLYGTSLKNMYAIISKLDKYGFILDSGKKSHNNTGRPSRYIILNFFNDG